MDWTPSTRTGRYNRRRAESVDPIEEAIKNLGLPLIRFRKLNGILNALVMQIEDGGDNPEVNGLLLDALRAAIRHQVGDDDGAEALQATDAFAQAESERWRRARERATSTAAPLPAERLDRLLIEGYDQMDAEQDHAACDLWLQAWEIVKDLAKPELRSAESFEDTYDLPVPTEEWAGDLGEALDDLGAETPTYLERRTRLAAGSLNSSPTLSRMSYRT